MRANLAVRLAAGSPMGSAFDCTWLARGVAQGDRSTPDHGLCPCLRRDRLLELVAMRSRTAEVGDERATGGGSRAAATGAICGLAARRLDALGQEPLGDHDRLRR